VDRETRSLGRIVRDCQDTVLYPKVKGRITELREFVENVLQPVSFGAAASNIFRAMLCFDSLPNLLKRADIVRIPWGIKPNYYMEPGTPFAPSIVIVTPGGSVVLTWNGSQYIGDGYQLTDESGDWCLTGPDVDHCFSTQNPLCETFPEGFSFSVLTGPPIDFEILRFEQALDDVGAYHHTRIEMELVTDNNVRGD